MLKASLFIVLGVVAGAGLATLLDREPMPGLGGSTTAFDAGIGQTGDLSLRLTALEAALAEETARRESLEANLTRLEEQLGGLAPTESTNETRVVDLDEAVLVNPGVEGVRGPRSARFAAIREQRSPEYRQNRLVEAGFSPEQAQLLVDREAQMRMEIMNASYEARRQGESFNPSDLQRAAHVELRTELGTDAYERYLEATGQLTSVNIYEVIDNSAGKNAGLQTGDEIVGYNGERVYSLRDLRGLTIAGEPGETVTVDIVRDGQPMQLYMPRGPLGISGGGRGTSTAVFVP